MSVLGVTEYVAHEVLSIIAYHECGGDFVAGVTERWGSSSGDYPVLPADNARSIARVKDRLFVGFADAGVAEIDLADKADVEKHYSSSSDPDLIGDDIYSMTGSLLVGSRSRGATKLRLDWLRADDPNAEVTEYTYNEANELVSLIEDSEDVTTFGYDANGNMVWRAEPQGTTTYTYNTWDRMVGVNTADGKSVAYGYDVNGLRVLREDETGERSRYLLDGVHVLAEFDELGSEQKMWATYNPTRVDEILSAVTPERGKQHYHLDGLGSVTAISDGVQRLMQAERYLAWGGSAGSQGNIDQPFMFTGREFEKTTGLQYNRARWLDSGLGRWSRRDDLRFSALHSITPTPGMELGLVRVSISEMLIANTLTNLYSYSIQNPVVYKDPSGEVHLDPRDGFWESVLGEVVCHVMVEMMLGITLKGALLVAGAVGMAVVDLFNGPQLAAIIVGFLAMIVVAAFFWAFARLICSGLSWVGEKMSEENREVARKWRERNKVQGLHLEHEQLMDSSEIPPNVHYNFQQMTCGH